MSATAERKSCRSTGPKGELCPKARGHKYSDWASNHKKLHGGPVSAWTGGVNTPARYVTSDDGYMTEADYQAWGRL